YIANGAYDKKVAASTPWTHGSSSATLNTDGSPGANQFSLKADDAATIDNAVLVTAHPTYISIDDSGTQTTEAGDTITTNTLWLKLGESFDDITYSGAIYYQIADGS
ncbi:unnamed protein product, partial [marine sediment metagenome]